MNRDMTQFRDQEQSPGVRNTIYNRLSMHNTKQIHGVHGDEERLSERWDPPIRGEILSPISGVKSTSTPFPVGSSLALNSVLSIRNLGRNMRFVH